MTGVRHELNALLVEQLDTLDDLIRQRDSARAWASEYIRRVDLAEQYIFGMTALDGIAIHELRCILAGDL